jgi:hypothetical protein
MLCTVMLMLHNKTSRIASWRDQSGVGNLSLQNANGVAGSSKRVNAMMGIELEYFIQIRLSGMWVGMSFQGRHLGYAREEY